MDYPLKLSLFATLTSWSYRLDITPGYQEILVVPGLYLNTMNVAQLSFFNVLGLHYVLTHPSITFQFWPSSFLYLVAGIILSLNCVMNTAYSAWSISVNEPFVCRLVYEKSVFSKRPMSRKELCYVISKIIHDWISGISGWSGLVYYYLCHFSIDLIRALLLLSYCKGISIGRLHTELFFYP